MILQITSIEYSCDICGCHEPGKFMPTEKITPLNQRTTIKPKRWKEVYACNFKSNGKYKSMYGPLVHMCPNCTRGKNKKTLKALAEAVNKKHAIEYGMRDILRRAKQKGVNPIRPNGTPLATTFRELRNKVGLSMSGVAQKADTSLRIIEKIERGQLSKLNYGTIMKLSGVLKCAPADLISVESVWDKKPA